MGGVDLHDNAVSNYRITIRSKKWWWPLWLSVLESSLVNAWKINSFVNSHQNPSQSSQLSFRVEVATKLLLTPDFEDDDDIDDIKDETVPPPIPSVSGHHQCVNHSENKARRCKVCHKPTQRLCLKCQVHLHIGKCFATYHNWEIE